MTLDFPISGTGHEDVERAEQVLNRSRRFNERFVREACSIYSVFWLRQHLDDQLLLFVIENARMRLQELGKVRWACLQTDVFQHVHRVRPRMAVRALASENFPAFTEIV